MIPDASRLVFHSLAQQTRVKLVSPKGKIGMEVTVGTFEASSRRVNYPHGTKDL
jgi:hypothetical protein